MGESEPSVQCENPECASIAHRIISTPNVLVGIPTHEARRGRGRGK